MKPIEVTISLKEALKLAKSLIFMVPPHGLFYVVVPSIGTNLLNTFCLPIVFPRLFSKSKLILSYGLSYGVPKGGKMTTQILI